jgi:hypothetical protein
MVVPRKTAELAMLLIADPSVEQGSMTGDLTIHADRETSMTSKSVTL